MFGGSYEMPSDAKPVQLDPTVAERYVGRYEVPRNAIFENRALGSLKRPGESMILEIANKGGALVLRQWISPGGGGSFGVEDQLVPQSDGAFRSAGLRVRITFTTDSSGRILRMELHDGAQTVSARRIDQR